MDFGNNVKHLRKSELKLSRAEFGKRLGVSADVINNIELGRLARPEQKEPLLRLICKTFNVSYEWLTTGQGDIFIETVETFLDGLTARFDISPYAHKVIECYLKLDKGQQDVIEMFFEKLVEACNAGIPNELAVDEAMHRILPSIIEESATKIDSPLSIEEEADEFAEMARKQFLLEKKRALKISSAKESGAG